MEYSVFARGADPSIRINQQSKSRGSKAGRARIAIRRIIPVVAAAALSALCFSQPAIAGVCDQFLGRVGGPNVQETAALNRQLAALGALERKRQCGSKSRGGFFNACGDIANRKAEVLRKLSRATGGGKGRLTARMVALGCAPGKRTKKERAVAAVKRSESGVSFGRNAMLFCVRNDDGYFFPVPGSQFVGSDDYKDVVDQCRYICQNPATAVYRLDDPSLETEEMRSVENGTVYKDLPNAFAYRDVENFQGCDFQRYYKRVDEARARTVTPFNMRNAIIPLPQEKPDISVPTMAYSGDVAPPARQMPQDKVVRVVGPNFFPD